MSLFLPFQKEISVPCESFVFLCSWMKLSVRRVRFSLPRARIPLADKFRECPSAAEYIHVSPVSPTEWWIYSARRSRPPSPGVNRRCSSQSPRVHVTDVQIHYEPIYEPKKIIPCVSSACALQKWPRESELPAALSAILHKKSKTIITYARAFALFMCCEE